MRSFPFKVLFFSLFLPPVCYILTLQALEGYMKRREVSALDRILIQNDNALYEGRYSVKEEINRNIGEYFSRSLKYSMGVRMDILVKSGDDRILYPAQLRKDLKDPQSVGEFTDPSAESLNYMEVAAENFRILHSGLTLSLDLEIQHNSWISNTILTFYVLLFVLILKTFIMKGVREAEKEELEQRRLLQHYFEQLGQAEGRLKEAQSKEANYQHRIDELRREKRDLSKDMDELLEEVEKLDEGAKEQRKLREDMELKAIELKGEIEHLKDMFPTPRQRRKRMETTAKRLKTLYKNITFTERAIEGFLSLPDEFQLKAEEIIHRINVMDASFHVKRKVFGKCGKMNILEVGFSYSGRLYFQKDSQNRPHILAIGTKNTQQRDLAYLENIP